MTLTFVSARFLVSLRTTGCILNIFLFTKQCCAYGGKLPWIWTHYKYSFLWIYHTSCVRITDVKNSRNAFTEVKDSHVFVTSVKKSHEFFTFDKNVRIFHTCDRFVWLSHSNERICHTCEEFARIGHTWEKFERILHMCDKYVRILHTSKIRHLWKTRTY